MYTQPMTWEDISNKFRGCAEFARWPSTGTEKIIGTVFELEKVANVADLAALLKVAGNPA